MAHSNLPDVWPQSTDTCSLSFDQPVPSCILPILAVMYYAIVKWSLEGDNEILDGYDDREDAFEALDNYQDRYPDGYLDVVKIGK